MIRQTLFTLFCFSVIVCMNGYNIEEVHTNPGWIITHANYYDTEKPPINHSDEEVSSESLEIINKTQQIQPAVQENPENLQNYTNSNWRKDIDEIKLGNNKYHVLLIFDKEEVVSNDKIEEDILNAVRNGSLTKISKKDFDSLVEEKDQSDKDNSITDIDAESSSNNDPTSDAVSTQLVIDNIATYFRQVYGRSFSKLPEADAEIINTEVIEDENEKTTSYPDETNFDGTIDINGSPDEENNENTDNKTLSNVNGKEDSNSNENVSKDKEESEIVKTNANERLELIHTLLDIIHSVEKFGYDENEKLQDLLLTENIKIHDTNSLTDGSVSKGVTIDENLLNEIFSTNKAHDDIDHIDDIDMRI